MHLPWVLSGKSPSPTAPRFPHSYAKDATLIPAAIINSDNTQDQQNTKHWRAAPVDKSENQQVPQKQRARRSWEQALSSCSPLPGTPQCPPPASNKILRSKCRSPRSAADAKATGRAWGGGLVQERQDYRS